ncbi:unnamed protein product [Penicillium salamii]|nr:unnamed protein product [Penicillium salamii]CAG8379292.1 unnamed protein product [Penicillium salamii]
MTLLPFSASPPKQTSAVPYIVLRCLYNRNQATALKTPFLSCSFSPTTRCPTVTPPFLPPLP